MIQNLKSHRMWVLHEKYQLLVLCVILIISFYYNGLLLKRRAYLLELMIDNMGQLPVKACMIIIMAMLVYWITKMLWEQQALFNMAICFNDARFDKVRYYYQLRHYCQQCLAQFIGWVRMVIAPKMVLTLEVAQNYFIVEYRKQVTLFLR